MKNMRKVTDLSFVKSNGKEIHLWEPERTGDYQKDCAAGNAYALELIRFMAECRNPTIFTFIVKAMPEKTGAVEVGFLTMIAMKAAEMRLAAV